MRCGFDRLAERVKVVIGQDPLIGHLFVFRSRENCSDSTSTRCE
jgi:transposase